MKFEFSSAFRSEDSPFRRGSKVRIQIVVFQKIVGRYFIETSIFFISKIQGTFNHTKNVTFMTSHTLFEIN